ncbi:MAG: diguanylate cyclase [Saccharothrix sp.]|nr:diguanylate cyclase [Saccharothrix sp.]
MEQRNRLVAGQVPQLDLEVKALLNAGRLPEANTLFDQVVSRVPPGADRWQRSAVLVNRAKLAWRLGRIPLALELAAEGWTDLEGEHSDNPAAAQAMHALAYLLEGIGNRRAAVDMLRLSVQVARRAAETSAEGAEVLAHCLQGLGGTLNFRAISSDPERAQAIFEEARGYLKEGLELAKEEQMRRALLAAYSRSLAGVGELEQAEENARETLRQAEGAGDKWASAVACWVLAVVRREQGDLVRARTLASRAVAASESINDPSLLLRFSLDLADICAEMGDHVGEATALRCSVSASRTATETLQEGLGQALEQRRVAVQAQRLAVAAQEAAARDPLTGLANRLGLERAAAGLLESTAARGRVPWLVLVDVDRFKGVNDDAGHAAGDATLREIAQLLRRECRAADLVARWAGDEFVVLLGDAEGTADAGPTVAERVRAAVDGHDWTVVLGTRRRPTVSIGVATGPANLDHLFAAADMALYRAKRLGRNRVEVEPHPPAPAPVPGTRSS